MSPVPMSVLALCAVLGSLFLAFCIVYSMRPSGTSLNLSAWPSPAWLYAQAALTLLTKPKSSKTTQSKGRGFKILQVALTKPTPCCPQRLAAFLQLAGFNSSQGPLPLSYPIVEAFRLVIQAMLLPDFPFNVLGSVLARNTTTVYRAMTADQPLIYSVQIDTGACRTTAKGHVEVDLVCQAVSAADGVAVWRSTTTAIILSSKRGQQPPSSTAGAKAAAKSDAPSGGSQRQVVVATWQLSSSTGRSYGLLNGDLNPIHLYPATSRLFGFKRPIAHALFLVARAEASLRQQGVQPLSYPVSLTADFKRPTLLPASLQFAWDPPTSAASAMSAGGQGVQFAVLTQDGGKEVLTGALRPVA
ncbi:hypothetical protein V8C86DRAFT_2737697 [Haematococcus lacustris]